MTPQGLLTTLYNFCSQPGCSDGAFPYYASLIQGNDGNLYGATSSGGDSTFCGPYGCGSIFKITTTGTLTTLYSFCLDAGCADGWFPATGLIQGWDGNFYGTTLYGGANQANACWGPIPGCGTVFTITPTGQLRTLYSFCSHNNQGVCADGYYPRTQLVQGNNGNLYGTTSGGGSGQLNSDGGTVFQITPAGALTTIHSFSVLRKKDGRNLQVFSRVLDWMASPQFDVDLAANHAAG
jgi:uncharacterized repeat protein (TIGR03803 family)